MESSAVKKGLRSPENHRFSTITTTFKTLVIRDGCEVLKKVWGLSSVRTHKTALNYIEGLRHGKNSTHTNSSNDISGTNLPTYGSVDNVKNRNGIRH